METQLKDIYWLAGLLEGEGCFDLNQSLPRIRLNMNDADTIRRAAGFLRRDGKTSWLTPRQLNRKGQYGVWVTGALAVGWMMTLYPLMGIRRQARIRQVIEMWRLTHECHSKGS